jgi:hypothetical protein
MSKMIQRVAFPDDCDLTPTSMTIPPGKPIEEWEGIVVAIDQAIRRRELELRTLEWYRIDALNYGEREYGEKYAQAVIVTGLSAHTLANKCWTGNKIPPDERHKDLSIEHHSAVAGLPAPERNRLLDLAEIDNASVWDLRRSAQDYRSREAGRDPLVVRAKAALTVAIEALAKLTRSQRARLVAESDICDIE